MASCDMEQGVNRGLPKLKLGDKPYTWYEFLPAWIMYLPVVAYWLLLALRYRSWGLPMLANPNIPLGGMVGESKAGILSQAGNVAAPFILPWVSIARADTSDEVLLAQALREMALAEIDFPIVAKPDLGCRGAGVSKCDSIEELRQYIRAFPHHRAFLIQQLAPWSAEAGVFYIRHPHAASGRIVSLTLKYRPTVTGDGRHTIHQLIRKHSRARRLAGVYEAYCRNRLDDIPASGEEVVLGFLGSHCRGSIFRDGAEWITPDLEKVFDRILQDVPEFYYGRLDIKFDTIESLARGERFSIIEINGASSEQTHIWDPKFNIFITLHVLLNQYRILFSIGEAVRRSGRKVPSAWQMIKTWIRELRAT